MTLRASRSLMVVTTLGVVVAAVAGPLLLPLVFGEPYEASVEPFLWLLPGAVGFTVLGVSNSTSFYCAGEQSRS